MASTIKTSISSVLTETPENTQERLIDKFTVHTPVSYNKGKTYIRGMIDDSVVATDVNIICLQSESLFNIKIGDTTAPELCNMKLFVYDGETTNIFVSNKSNDPIIINTVIAKL